MTTMVAAFGQRGMPAAGGAGEEFLDGGENDAAGPGREPLAQVGSALRLHRALPEEIGAARECGEELVVEVVAVGEDDDGGVLHARFAGDAGGVKRHGEALARPLGMPDDADAAVAGFAARPAAGFVAGPVGEFAVSGGAQGLGDGVADGVELVVAGDFLDDGAAGFEDDEVAEEIGEAAFVEQAADQHLQLRPCAGRELVAGDGAPRFEQFESGGQGTDAGLGAIGHGEYGVEDEQRGDFFPVCLQLRKRGAQGSVFAGGVLEFENCERQAIDEDDDVGAPFPSGLDDGELPAGEPAVVRGGVEVENADARAAHVSAAVAIRDRDAIDDHAVGGAVARFERGAFGAQQFARGVFQGGGGQAWVEFPEGCAKVRFENGIGVAGAPAAGARVGGARGFVAEPGEPLEGGFIHLGFGEGGHCVIRRGRWPGIRRSCGALGNHNRRAGGRARGRVRTAPRGAPRASRQYSCRQFFAVALAARPRYRPDVVFLHRP